MYNSQQTVHYYILYNSHKTVCSDISMTACRLSVSLLGSKFLICTARVGKFVTAKFMPPESVWNFSASIL